MAQAGPCLRGPSNGKGLSSEGWEDLEPVVDNDGQCSTFLEASPRPVCRASVFPKSDHDNHLTLKEVEEREEERRGKKEGLNAHPESHSPPSGPISVGGTATRKPRSLHLPRFIQAPHLPQFVPNCHLNSAPLPPSPPPPSWLRPALPSLTSAGSPDWTPPPPSPTVPHAHHCQSALLKMDLARLTLGWESFGSSCYRADHRPSTTNRPSMLRRGSLALPHQMGTQPPTLPTGSGAAQSVWNLHPTPTFWPTPCQPFLTPLQKALPESQAGVGALRSPLPPPSLLSASFPGGPSRPSASHT